MNETTFLRTREVAAVLQVSPGTVRRWRVLGTGPTYTMCGGAPRYSIDDLRRYLSERRFVRTADARLNRPVPVVAEREDGR